jgi:N-terminal 7TM region of histidine kinase
MNTVAIPCLALGTVNLCVGSFYLLLFLRIRKSQEHLAFALLCFGIALYDVSCMGLYNSQSLVAGVFWQRLQLVSLGPISILTIWFLGLVTEQRISRFLRLLMGVLCVLVLLASPTLSPSRPSIKTVYWGTKVLATYYESEVGLAFKVAMATSCVAYLYLCYLLFRAYLRTRSGHFIAMMVGYVTYFAGLLSDGMVSSRVYSFVYVSEYAYLLVILTMAYALLSKFVDLHLAVEDLNLSLKQRVETLHGLLPICAWCRKVRDDSGYWNQLEEYVREHTRTEFSHGICPDCARTLRSDECRPPGPRR